MYKLTLYVLAIWMVKAQVLLALAPFKGPCPANMTSVADLDIKRLLGKWYTYSMYPLTNRKMTHCKSTEFFEKGDGKYGVKTKEIVLKTDTILMRVRSILSVDPAGGKFVISAKNKAFPNGVEIYVLDTDYDNFAIQFTCFDSSNVVNFQSAVIYTRERVPPANVVFQAKKLAKDSGLKLKEMVTIQQEGCPSDS